MAPKDDDALIAASVPRDPIEALRAEYAIVAANLFAEMLRHEKHHGCDLDRCDIYLALRTAWAPFYDMSRALDWLLLGVSPELAGFPSTLWLEEFLPGPWAAEPVFRRPEAR